MCHQESVAEVRAQLDEKSGTDDAICRGQRRCNFSLVIRSSGLDSGASHGRRGDAARDCIDAPHQPAMLDEDHGGAGGASH